MIETSNNISFLVNQDDQISNVLSGNHSKGKLQGTILDFTVRQCHYGTNKQEFRYLYLLYAKSIVILDLRDLLNSKVNATNDIQIVESIQLLTPQQNQFNYIEVANSDDQSLLLFNDVASRRTGLAQANPSKVSGAESGKAAAKASILHIDCSGFQGNGSSSGASHVQTMLQIGHAEGEQSVKVDVPRGAILDVEIWDTFLAVLFEKNLVQVYDLA